MKRANRDDMRAEYDFSSGERGRYAEQYEEGTNIVRLAAMFPNSEAVNDALRALIRIAQRTGVAPPLAKPKKEVR